MNEPENKHEATTKLTPAQENEKAIQEKLQDAGQLQQESYTQTTPEQGSDVPPQEQTVGIP